MSESVHRKKRSAITRFFKTLGPGLITGASDDDPSGIATYSQAGARFGFSTLWMALLAFPLMTGIQEMCARIGMVTGKGLTGNIKTHYSKTILFLLLLFSFPAIVLNIGADIAGMGAVANMIVPSIPAGAFSVIFTVINLVMIIYLPYKKIAAILKYLCVFLLLYLIVPFLSSPDWWQVFKHTLVPEFHFDKEFIGMLVAILGTTISPYLFFWQATMEAEDVQHKKKKLIIDKKVIDKMKLDIDAGMFFSVLVMFFITLSTGTVLYNAGIHKIETVEQAAKALEPLAGKASYLLFAFGVIGTGFLAIPVLSGSLSYMASEAFNWESSLDKKYYEAKPFYTVLSVSLLLGLLINYIGISPVNALLYTAILYGLTAPVMVMIVLHISNNRKIMGEFVNGKWSNATGIFTLLIMSVSAFLLIWYQFTG